MKILTPEYAEKLFGDPTDKKTFKWMKLWTSDNYEKHHFFKAGLKFPKKIYMHIICIPLWEKIYKELITEGLTEEIYSIGWYNVRKQKGSKRWSVHSWSLGPDINPKENAQGTKGKMNPKIVEIFERNGFFWGGRFKGKSIDPMHFELSLDAVDAYFKDVLANPKNYPGIKIPQAWLDANSTASPIKLMAPEDNLGNIDTLKLFKLTGQIVSPIGTSHWPKYTNEITLKTMNNLEQKTIPFPEEVLESLNNTRYNLEQKLLKVNAAIGSVRNQINEGLNSANTPEGLSMILKNRWRLMEESGFVGNTGTPAPSIAQTPAPSTSGVSVSTGMKNLWPKDIGNPAALANRTKKRGRGRPRKNS